MKGVKGPLLESGVWAGSEEYEGMKVVTGHLLESGGLGLEMKEVK